MSEATNLKPGEARCPDHPSTKELVKNDATGAPDPILEESYQFLGDEDISFEEYMSDDYAETEYNHMWSKVWQWACHVDHIPKEGDYYVYDVGHLSALIVRTKNDCSLTGLNLTSFKPIHGLVAASSNPCDCWSKKISWQTHRNAYVSGRYDFTMLNR